MCSSSILTWIALRPLRHGDLKAELVVLPQGLERYYAARG